MITDGVLAVFVGIRLYFMDVSAKNPNQIKRVYLVVLQIMETNYELQGDGLMHYLAPIKIAIDRIEK